MSTEFTESLGIAALSSIVIFYIVSSYRAQQYSRVFWGILLLGLILRLYTGADQFLHQWDERYHALVAKNLLAHPFQPTLFDNPVIDYDPSAWCCNHIWLHKPPVPFWLMASSIGLFGTHEWAVRVPSLLLSLLAIVLTYHMAKAMFDRPTALIAAFLYAINGKLIELAAGRISSDHVETCHIVMFQLGVWFVWQNLQRQQRRSAILAGVFTGMAFMSKWTPASLIPMIWFLGVIWQKQIVKKIFSNALFLSAGAFLIAIPWMWFIVGKYPEESRLLWAGVLRANSEVIEGHTGPWYYYLGKVRIIFGELIYLPMLVGLYAIIRRPRWSNMAMLFLWIALPFVVFSGSATKRETYILVTAPAFFMLTAWAIRVLLLARRWKPKRQILYSVLAIMFLLLPIRYCAERAKIFIHYERRPEWMAEISNCQSAIPGPTDIVVFFGFEHNIEMMFHTGITTYAHIPPLSDLDRLKNEGYKVFLLEGGNIREY